MQTEQFIADRLAAFGSANVNALVAQYADDAVVITPQGTIRGRDQIRRMVEGIIAEFAKPGVAFDLLHKAAEGPVASFVWTADTAANTYHLGAETYVLAGGRVAFQTFAAKVTPK